MKFDTLEIADEGLRLIEKYGREIVIRAENKAAEDATKAFRPMSQYWIESFLRSRKTIAKHLSEKQS